MIKNLFAHPAVYPHFHPHPTNSKIIEGVLALLFILSLTGVCFIVLRFFHKKRKSDS